MKHGRGNIANECLAAQEAVIILLNTELSALMCKLDVHLAIGCGEQVRSVLSLLHQPVDTVYLAGHRVGSFPSATSGAIIFGGCGPPQRGMTNGPPQPAVREERGPGSWRSSPSTVRGSALSKLRHSFVAVGLGLGTAA